MIVSSAIIRSAKRASGESAEKDALQRSYARPSLSDIARPASTVARSTSSSRAAGLPTTASASVRTNRGRGSHSNTMTPWTSLRARLPSCVVSADKPKSVASPVAARSPKSAPMFNRAKGLLNHPAPTRPRCERFGLGCIRLNVQCQVVGVADARAWRRRLQEYPLTLLELKEELRLGRGKRTRLPSRKRIRTQ